jgi:hypothetical protein
MKAYRASRMMIKKNAGQPAQQPDHVEKADSCEKGARQPRRALLLLTRIKDIRRSQR